VAENWDSQILIFLFGEPKFDRDGTFSIMLPAGYYFLIAQSNRSKLDDGYAPVKISEGEITQVLFEMTFLD
jgi:hypothetical protein